MRICIPRKKWLMVMAVFFIAIPLFSQSINWERTNPSLNDNLNSISITPQGTLYAGGFGGAYRSTDKGENWTAINTNLVVNNKVLKVFSIEFQQNGTLYAATSGAGVYKSTDNGNSWAASSNGLTDSYVNTLTVASNGNIYAGTSYNGIFLSTNNGGSWSRITPDSGSITGTNKIIILPDGDFFAVGSAGVFRSTDNGKTWLRKIRGMGEKPNVYTITFKPSTSEIFVGTRDGKIYRTVNKGEQWVVAFDIGSNEQVFALTTRSNNDVFAGTWGKGAFMLREGTSNWVQINDGLETNKIMALALHPDGTVFAATWDKGVYRGNQSLISVDFSGQFCEGTEINVPFITLIEFGNNNVFTLQLSNSSGAFTSPVNLGTLAGKTSGTIKAKIPKGVPNGFGYRLRVVASEPSTIGSSNGSDISIFKFPTPNIGGSEVACSNTQQLYSSSGFSSVQFKWSVTGGTIIGPDDQKDVEILWQGSGTGTISLKQVNGISGCEDSITRSLEILPVSNEKAIITRDGNFLFSSKSNGNQWYLNGKRIPGATSESYFAKENGVYTVTWTTENGCPSPHSDPFDFILGIKDDFTSATGFVLYPNPASGVINFKPESMMAGEASYYIMNLVGEVIISGSISSESNSLQQIDINFLPDGMYMFKLQNGNRTETKTFVKVR